MGQSWWTPRDPYPQAGQESRGRSLKKEGWATTTQLAPTVLSSSSWQPAEMKFLPILQIRKLRLRAIQKLTHRSCGKCWVASPSPYLPQGKGGHIQGPAFASQSQQGGSGGVSSDSSPQPNLSGAGHRTARRKPDAISVVHDSEHHSDQQAPKGPLWNQPKIQDLPGYCPGVRVPEGPTNCLLRPKPAAPRVGLQ